MDWTDIYTGNTYRITDTVDPANPDAIPVNTLRNVIDTWATNPEPKSLTPDGQVCRHDTIGLLQRRPVRTTPGLVTLVGKESNHLEEAQAGLKELGDVLNEYPDPERDPWHRIVMPAIEQLEPAAVAQTAGVNRRTVERLVQGTPPRPATKQRVIEAVRTLADLPTGAGLEEGLAAFLEATDQHTCAECGAPLTNRRRNTRYCNNTCRMRSRRRGAHKDSTETGPVADN